MSIETRSFRASDLYATYENLGPCLLKFLIINIQNSSPKFLFVYAAVCEIKDERQTFNLSAEGKCHENA